MLCILVLLLYSSDVKVSCLVEGRALRLLFQFHFVSFWTLTDGALQALAVLTFWYC